MKPLRTFVLLLLVLLLPVRGAVAATMPCSTAGETPQARVAVHDHGGHAHHSEHGAHGDSADHDHAGSHHDGKAGHADICNLCASGGCHATPLAAAPPEVLDPLLTARVVFPALSVAAPAFQSDGQERPPRSI